METVKDWLLENRLDEYCNQFEENGWDDMYLLPEMTYADIETCIQKRGHILKFKKAIEKYVTNSDTAKDIPTIIYKRTTDSSTQVGAEGFVDNYESSSTFPDAELGKHRHEFSDARHDSDDIVTPSQSKLLKVDEEEFHTRLSTAIALPTAKTEDLSSDESDYENDRNQPLAVISNLNTTAVFDAEVPSHPAVNFTYIKHSEHTNVSAEPAQIITEPNVSASASDNFKGQMEAIASWHAKRDIRFVETSAMKEIQEVLEDKHWVTILGKPGEGKTAMAAHLMLKYKEREYEPVFLSAASEWKSSISGGKSKQFVVVDDMFGTTCLDRKKVDEWLSWLENMGKIVEEAKGNILIVCTNRQYIFDEIKSKLEKFSSFRSHQIVNLSSKMFNLTQLEKLAIFNAYADEKDRKAAIDDEMKALDPPHGFPHCVEMFHTNVHLRNKGMAFFKNPSKYVRNEIYNFKDDDRVKYLVLLIVLLCKNQLKDKVLDQWLYDHTDSQRRKVIKALGIPSDKLADIRKNLTLLEGTYIEKGPDGDYCFTHESLMENVAYVFASANHSLAMEILDLKYITTFFRQLGSDDARQLEGEAPPVTEVEGPHASRKHATSFNFHQKVGSMKPLAKRLVEEVKIGNMLTVSTCNALRDQTLLKEWIGYISKEPEEVLQSIFCSPANIRDNLLISLTEFSMDNAVLSVLQDASILKKIRNNDKWMDVLQSGLECSALEKDSIVFEAFANAAHFKQPPCRLQGSRLLLDALQNDTSKYAMVLIRETEIDPHYKDRYDRGYFHHLVKARITDEVFEKLLDFFSDLGADINSKDFMGLSPLDICINYANSANPAEGLEMEVDRFLFLLSKGAACSVIQTDCYSLLKKVRISQFYTHIAQLTVRLLTPVLQNVPILDLFSVDLTNMIENTCHIFVKVLRGIIEETNTIRTENMPAAYQVNCSNLHYTLMDVCNKHFRLSLQQFSPEDLDRYHRFSEFSPDATEDTNLFGYALEDACYKYLPNSRTTSLFIVRVDVFSKSKKLRRVLESSFAKYFEFLQLQPPLEKKIYHLALQDLCTEDLEVACEVHSRTKHVPDVQPTDDLRILVETVCQKNLKNLLKSVWRETSDSEQLKLAVMGVCNKHLQLALEAVCKDSNNLSLMETLSTAESKKALDKLDRYYNALARMGLVDVLRSSVEDKSLHANDSRTCSLGYTLGNCSKLISSVYNTFRMACENCRNFKKS